MMGSIPGAFPGGSELGWSSHDNVEEDNRRLPFHRGDITGRNGEPSSSGSASERTPLLSRENNLGDCEVSPSRDDVVSSTPVAEAATDGPAQENLKGEGRTSRPPESTLNQFQSRFGDTGISWKKAGPMARKAGKTLWSASTATVAFGARQAVNSGAAGYFLPKILPNILPVPEAYKTKLARVASDLIHWKLQKLVQEEPADSVAEALAQSSRDSAIDQAVAKRVAKTIKFDKFDKLIQPYLAIFTDAKLTLQENAQLFADAVREETKQFEEDHPELKEQFGLLREKVKAYQPKFADQNELDREILGVLITPKIMSEVPYLPKNISQKEIFKTAGKRQLFDDALSDVLKRAKEDEIESLDDVEIFHTRWANLTLSDDMPFMLIAGEGALANAREWCKKVDEKPIEVDADDLVEMLTGSRPKDAKPPRGAVDPSPVNQLGGFYSRIESGNPASPMIITGFDSHCPDHAGLIPLLEGSNEISFPYKDIPGVFNFNTKGMAVFLCEEDAPMGEKTKLEVAAGDKPKDKAPAADKAKNKGKDKAPADDKTKDKAKEKASDGEKNKNKGLERLKVIPRAIFKSPSETRRSKKLEEALETKLVDRLDTIVQTDDPALSAALKDCIKDTVCKDEYKKLILEKSMEYKVTLKQTEEALLFLVERIAAKYRLVLAQTGNTGNPGGNVTAPAETETGTRISAFEKSKEKKEIDQNLGAFIENYFKRFKKDEASKKEDMDNEGKSSSNPAQVVSVEPEDVKDASSDAVQAKRNLPRNQTTLMSYFKPTVPRLLAAATNGNMEMLAQQLDNPECKLSETDKERNTALHLAVQNERIDAVRALLQYSDINAQNSAGSTASHLAISRGNEKLVDLLLEKHESIDFKLMDKSGNNLLEAARKQAMNGSGIRILGAVMKADPKSSEARFVVLSPSKNATAGTQTDEGDIG
jgi:hypothetical protein